MSLILTAYRHIMTWLDPWALGLMKAHAQSLDRDRLNERRGFDLPPRPDGHLIWLHGVSVGEALCALSLGQVLQSKTPLSLLITTHTKTAAQLIEKRRHEGNIKGLIHQYAPLDTPPSIDRFLDHWRPDVHIGIEQDIWPNWLSALKSRSIEAHLVSARLTDKSMRKWQKLPETIKSILSTYDGIWPQDKISQGHFQTLGAKSAPLLNLKTIGSALIYDHDLKRELAKEIGTRPIWLAASTHMDEEIHITYALEQAMAKNHLLIICPRHSDRADEIETALNHLGHTVLRRSRGELPAHDTKLYLADSLGEMGLWYALSDHIIMGGSFFPQIGGHNPLEAARLQKGVISGPYVENWASIYQALQTHEACLMAPDLESLSLIISNLMINSEKQTQWNHNAYQGALTLEAKTDQALETLAHQVIMSLTNPNPSAPC